MKIILQVKNCLRNLFYFRHCSINCSQKDITNLKTQKTDIFEVPVVWLCGVILAHRRVKLHNVHHTVESSDPNFWKSSAVCIIRWSQALRSPSQGGFKLRTMHHTRESPCTPWSQNKKIWCSLVAFKGTIGRNPFRGEHFYHERKDLKYKKLQF